MDRPVKSGREMGIERERNESEKKEHREKERACIVGKGS